MNQNPQALSSYISTSHLKSSTLLLRQVLASRYVHDCDHVIEIGGGDLPIAPYLLEFSKRPMSYVTVDLRYRDDSKLPGMKGEYTLIPFPKMGDEQRAVCGRHDDVGLEELARCKGQGETIGLVILGCSIRTGYDVLLDMALQSTRVVFEYRKGKSIESNRRLENDLTAQGFKALVELSYVCPDPMHQRRLVILDKSK